MLANIDVSAVRAIMNIVVVSGQASKGRQLPYKKTKRAVSLVG